MASGLTYQRYVVLLRQHNGLTMIIKKILAPHVFASVDSFAEYVPAPCTHRPSSHPSGFFVRLALSESNKKSARRAKS